MSGRRLIEVQRLSKNFGWLPVLRGLDLLVQRGEFVLLLGANGSGKSTLLRLLCGLSRATSGVIRIGGWSLPEEAQAVRAQIGLLAHRPLLYENLTARENLDFFAALYDIAAAERARRRDNLLQQVGLADRADGLVRGFSRGMQQRLSLARALLHQPDLLLLDEPYTGLDNAGCAMLDELLTAASNSGCTIIMSTHQLERKPAHIDRALVLADGSMVYDGQVNGDLAALFRQATASA
ncbi:MAG: heme ABC exporter ATP-binding protein CcmA [Chloroflexi bacterium]|nr:heme ABC exporter ATP-binding protein CcmA [Chloroflexota bacterium]